MSGHLLVLDTYCGWKSFPPNNSSLLPITQKTEAQKREVTGPQTWIPGTSLPANPRKWGGKEQCGKTSDPRGLGGTEKGGSSCSDPLARQTEPRAAAAASLLQERPLLLSGAAHCGGSRGRTMLRAGRAVL